MKKLSWFLLFICLAHPVFAQVAAHKTVTLQVDADANGKVTPGDTLRYTIVITNTSSTNLLNVQFADTGFSNQTLVASSIKSTPVARPDSYATVIGNTLFNVAAASGVLANDSDPDGDAVTVVGFSATSAHGGTVTVTNNGGFAFLPAAGYQGSDTFTYTISDGNGGTNSTTVTLLINNLVWYVNNAGANGDGRQTSPFNSLTGAATASAANDFIYAFQGSGNYTAGITLKNGQNLVGSGDRLVVGGTTILNAGSRPTILIGSGTGMSLASNNIVHGINIGSSSGRAFSGGAVGSLIVSNVIATATGGASVVLTNGTVNVALDSATSTGSADNGIALNAINGSLVISGGSIGTAAGTDFVVAGGNGTITYAGSINNAAGRSVDISGRTGGTVTLSGAITDTATGIIVQNNTGGTTTFSGASKSLSTGANTAVTLTSNTGHTINFSNGGLAITTTTATGFNATGGGTVTVTTGATANTLSSTTGTALNVVNTTIGASGMTFQSISANGAANGIILNNTGGSGGLNVTGTGATAGSGGTIQNNVQGALFTATTSLSLANMNFINSDSGNGTVNNIDGPTFNSAAQAAINLSSVATASFVNLTVNGNGGAGGAQVGINGQNVTNLTIANSVVTGFGDTVAEGDVKLFNLLGTSVVTNSSFSFVNGDTTAGENLFEVRNTLGTLTLTVAGCSFTNTRSSTSGAGGVAITGTSNATVTLNVWHSSFLNLKTSGVEAFARMTSTVNANITDGGVSGNGNIFLPVGGTSRAIGLNSQDTAHLNFNINRNQKIYGYGGPIINIYSQDLANNQGRIDNNLDIENNSTGVNFAGSPISVSPLDSSTNVMEIVGNSITNYGQDANISVTLSGDGISKFSAAADITISSNTVTLSGTNLNANIFNNGLLLSAGANNSDLTTLTANFQANSVIGITASNGNAALAFENTGGSGTHAYFEGFTASGQATWSARGNTPGSSYVELVNVNEPAAIPAGHNGGHTKLPANPTQ